MENSRQDSELHQFAGVYRVYINVGTGATHVAHNDVNERDIPPTVESGKYLDPPDHIYEPIDEQAKLKVCFSRFNGIYKYVSIVQYPCMRQICC